MEGVCIYNVNFIYLYIHTHFALDRWKLSADQLENSEGLHYDELYVANRSDGDGLISRTGANQPFD